MKTGFEVTGVEADFADGRYRFWLPMPQVNELEAANDTSLFAIEWGLNQAIGINEKGSPVFLGGQAIDSKIIRETIRLALIGGNGGIVDGQEIEVGPMKAKQLVENYLFPARPIGEAAALAWLICSTAIYGRRDLTPPAPGATPGGDV